VNYFASRHQLQPLESHEAIIARWIHVTNLLLFYVKAHIEGVVDCALCKAVFKEYRSMLRDQTIQVLDVAGHFC
jgi:hypothetical protein